MRRFKKITALMLAGVMAVSMAGCKNTKNGTATDTDADSDKSYPEATVIEDDGDWSTTEVQEDEVERFTTVEGADVMGFDFEDNNVGPFVTYTNGGDMSLYAENGELVCEINKVGRVEHGCQIYYDGFTMARDCVYTMKFDIRCDIERSVQWRVQINGGDYHAYASDYVNLGPETQSVSYEFTMSEESDPAPRFVINMGGIGEDTDLPAHKIYVDNISLIVTDSSKAEKIEGAPKPITVKVNQIGYHPEDYKKVVVDSLDDTKFKIVKADTEETVYIGNYGEEKFDKAVQHQIKSGEFTDFQSPGRYKIISSPSGASYEFSIGTDIYDDVYRDVVLMLYKQRCGVELQEDIAGNFAHVACHTGEAVIFDNEAAGPVDVSGGWHDAGDYGRYVVPGAKTVYDLLLAYEDFECDMDDMGIPESGNGVPDLLDEARYELDWMLKMQDLESGGVYHKVTCEVFPEIVKPEEETDQLIISPVSYTATADFAAVMAKASSDYAEYDAEFAQKCLEAAKNAYTFLEANPDMRGFVNPGNVVTGAYSDRNSTDELLWAAAELYLVTNDEKYISAINSYFEANNKVIGLGWADVSAMGLYDLAKAEDIDGTVKQTATELIIEEADKHVEACVKEVFETGLGEDYAWGSNMAVANNIQLMLMANRLSENPEYMRLASVHRDYIFGCNPVGYCYVTGYGSNSPHGTHHRPSQVLGETMPGMLVGGANAGLNDPYSKAVLAGMPGGMAYVDNEQSYSCNEITIYWNSPLIYAMAGLMNK